MSEEQPETDHELFLRFVDRRDEEAFAEVMKRNTETVFKASFRVLGNRADAEDATQVVFMRLGRETKRMCSDAHLRNWLVCTALSQATSLLRSRQARALREESVAQRSTVTDRRASGESKERDQILGILGEELYELPSRYRDAIYGFYMNDQSVQEIAEAMGKNTQCVKDLLRNGRKKLGERIKKRLSVTPAAVIGVLENLPEAPPMREGFIEETMRAAMQIRKGLTPTGLSPNVSKLLAAKGSWTLSKILAGVSALIICVAGGAVVTHHVLVRRATVASSTAPSESAPETPVTSGMVLIPGGTNAGTDPDTKKSYSLTVESFLMDRCEVTKALWDEVAEWGGGHGYVFPQRTVNVVVEMFGLGKAPDHPVHSVSWWDCVLWCNMRSEKDGFEPVYYDDKACTVVIRTNPTSIRRCPFVKATADGYRLPTLEEWQYAARCGEPSHRFPWHDTDTIDHTRANYGNPPSREWDKSPASRYHPTYAVEPNPYTSPVGAFPANAYGLYDMVGNVSEWCDDAADESGWQRKYTSGSWKTLMDVHHCSNRRGDDRSLDMGFRTVRTPRSIGAATD